MNLNKLERTLRQKEIVNEEQLLDARKKSIGSKRSVQEELVDMGYLEDETLLNVMAELYSHVEVVDLENTRCFPEIAG